VAVEIVKISHDNRHRKSYRQHTGNHAQRPDQLTPDTNRSDVTVTYGCHGNDRPPERARNRRELRLVLSQFGVVRSRTEDDYCDEEEENEHKQLSQASSYRHAQDAQTLRMFRQLEYADDA